ncbi:phosphoenolpyruvate synthase, partial [Candidatus Sumerlaeota bacterium]|nr:phosphoenolpyruvate synthase [Candidatus Sumerlaeota bacterium]
GFAHMKVALSIGVQKMLRSDKGASGVMFTLDTETGFPNAIMINAAWGLGENVVKGTINPDEYYVFKLTLHDKSKKPILRKTLGAKEKKMIFAHGGHHTTKNLDTPKAERVQFALEDTDILQLADWALAIETHYSGRAGRPTPMDIEWALDGENGHLYIVQARPETVERNKSADVLISYSLREKGKVLVKGRSVGEAIAAGKVCVIRKAGQIEQFKPGSILVAEMTDPDWVPIMRQAAGIVTDHGGRTCHAAIVSRELGIPAIVGTGDATEILKDDQEITLSCAEGQEGRVYEGILKFRKEEVRLEQLGKPRAEIMMNLADPSSAFQWWRMPCDGIGLARMEFIITNDIRIHPMALVQFDRVKDAAARAHIEEICRNYADKPRFFVETLARGVAMIAASQYPKPVIVRMSDFKTNEYANLIGGTEFEPKEENPMIGFRGASRYYSDLYRPGFALECRAMKYAREVIGLDNIILMIPFCRTLEEADRVLAVMAEEGLKRGENSLKIYVMCEIPSNVILAKDFAKRFDGFSIGSNDLTQLTLGIDRDSERLAPLFDERNPAVKELIRDVIRKAHEVGSHVGICGQAPSDYPEFCDFLVEARIDSISLNPDSVISVRRRLSAE